MIFTSNCPTNSSWIPALDDESSMSSGEDMQPSYSFQGTDGACDQGAEGRNKLVLMKMLHTPKPRIKPEQKPKESLRDLIRSEQGKVAARALAHCHIIISKSAKEMQGLPKSNSLKKRSTQVAPERSKSQQRIVVTGGTQ
ncbi:unnamed protein product [Phytophthora fragariaefolia]|uniref:Unnamed protein product n=1 Tax=Phytophthora fragariaefolia TaxID=1490495 RepID=A0A9W6XSM2_9STRA|nr:unnamed protein product [Phytophthora fragariaefolia]